MDGYPRLGRLMGESPPLAIFRRYGTLNAQNILYMQAEINELEKELQEISSQDRYSDNIEKQRYSREWWRLARAQGGDSLQWKKCLELREKLNEYNASLLRAREVFTLAAPLEQDLSFLRTWLSRPKSGDNFLRGLEASIWDSHNTEDLAALATRPGERDVFTNWIVNTFLPAFHRSIGRRIFRSRSEDEEAGFAEYKDSKLTAGLTIFVTLLSSTIPVTSIVALYLIEGMLVRLLSVGLFMIIFCSILAIFTSARRVEIFAATAANICSVPSFYLRKPLADIRNPISFASVQVVFVGTTTVSSVA